MMRDHLAGLLWPNSEQEQSYYNLRQVIMQLRKLLGSEAHRLFSPTLRMLQFDLEGAFVDVLAFDNAVRKGDEAGLTEAIALYRGPLLEDCTEEWANEARELRRQDYLRALEMLARHYYEQDNPGEAIRYLRILVVADPWRETAYRSLMQALAANGERAGVSQVYRDLRLFLQRELRMEPAKETQDLYRQLRSEVPPAAAHSTSLVLNPQSPGVTQISVEETTLVQTKSASEPVGGAMPVDSPFYIVRPADDTFMRALSASDGIVLIQGARQIGKTSMLARGLQRMRYLEERVVITDFRAFAPAQLESQENLMLALAQDLHDQLDLEVTPSASWDPDRSANTNLERYLRRQVLTESAAPLVWAFDEADALIAYEFSSNVFGLFRSWFNRRALDPAGPWHRLTIVLVYAHEAHMFMTKHNLSPFNVGTEISLGDFVLEQVADLNERYGSPLNGAAEVAGYHALLSGHPYLTRSGLRIMSETGLTLRELEQTAASESSPFIRHLRQMAADLVQDEALTETIRNILRGMPCGTTQEYSQLRSMGILAGDGLQVPRFRCPVYRSYLQHCLL